MVRHCETLHVEINLCFKQHKLRNFIPYNISLNLLLMRIFSATMCHI